MEKNYLHIWIQR